ncbi:MAG: hypothetical protein WCB15_26355, partial [Desulfobacterales bacterium]
IYKDVGKKWLKEATEISAMLNGLIKTKRGFLKKINGLLLSFNLYPFAFILFITKPSQPPKRPFSFEP